MAVTIEHPPPQSHPRQVRELIRATAGGAVVLIAVVGLYLSAAPYDKSAGPAARGAAPALRLLPSALGSLDRAWSLTGVEALREVRDLHLGTFRMATAEVAGYGEDATVWVATPDRPDAVDRYVTRMADAISSADTPFSSPVASRDGPRIWWTEGAGQRHVFFAADGAIWWLSADADDARAALSALLREVGP